MFKVGIIGLGQIASDIDDDPERHIIWSHAKAYNIHPQTKITRIFDVNQYKLDSFSKKWNVPHACNSIDAFLENFDLDIVSICSPTETHYEILKLLLNTSVKAVFCEKPLTHSVTKSEEVVHLYKEKNIPLVVNFMRRHDPIYTQPKQWIENGDIGALTTITAYGSTALMMSTSHVIDMMLFYGGPAEWIIGHLQSDFVREVHGQPDPGGHAFIHFKNGTTGFLKGTSASPAHYMFEIDLLGTEGRITISDDGRSVSFYKFKDINTSTGTGYKTLVQENRTIVKSERMIIAIDNIIECINHDIVPLSGAHLSAENVKVIESIKQSNMSNNQKVYLL